MTSRFNFPCILLLALCGGCAMDPHAPFDEADGPGGKTDEWGDEWGFDWDAPIVAQDDVPIRARIHLAIEFSNGGWSGDFRHEWRGEYAQSIAPYSSTEIACDILREERADRVVGQTAYHPLGYVTAEYNDYSGSDYGGSIFLEVALHFDSNEDGLEQIRCRRHWSDAAITYDEVRNAFGDQRDGYHVLFEAE